MRDCFVVFLSVVLSDHDVSCVLDTGGKPSNAVVVAVLVVSYSICSSMLLILNKVDIHSLFYMAEHLLLAMLSVDVFCLHTAAD